MQSDLEEYLDVLGLQESFDSKSLSQKASHKTEVRASNEGLGLGWHKSAELVVIIAETQHNSEATELLLKMLSAIDRDPKNTALWVLSTQDLSNSPDLEEILGVGHRRALLAMGDGVSKWLLSANLEQSSQFQSYTTHSAEDCLNNPGLKKVVWENLKSLRSQLGAAVI